MVISHMISLAGMPIHFNNDKKQADVIDFLSSI